MREDTGNPEVIIFSNATIVAFRFSADYYIIALYFCASEELAPGCGDHLICPPVRSHDRLPAGSCVCHSILNRRAFAMAYDTG